ncbi:MAG: aspartate dehydrogenase [Lachnospiraceae bacterium]
MFGKKKAAKKTYDASKVEPVLRVSICTGEKVAGFRDLVSGKVVDEMLIGSDEDLARFKEMYGISELKKVY